MSDAAITTIVTGAVTIVLALVGFCTLWLKLRFAVKEATKAAKAATATGIKLDENTELTESVNTKADTIVDQTNGTLEHTRSLVTGIAERVGKLEDYNRSSAHRILDALNAQSLKTERILALLDAKSVRPVGEEGKKEGPS